MLTQTVYVQSIAKKTAKNGEYLDLVVRERKGDQVSTVNAKIWPNVNRPQPIEPRDILAINYVDDEWNGKRQLNIQRYLHSNPDCAKDFELPSAVDSRQVYDTLFRRKWSDQRLKVLFDNIDEDLRSHDINGVMPSSKAKLIDILFDAPAGSAYHHARRGGLLQHIEEMFGLAASLRTNGTWIDVDWEVLLASILLHDLGKIHEYNPETLEWAPSLVGEHIPHTCWLPIWLASLQGGAALDGKVLKVIHCVLAHHGIEGGAPIFPKTPEAILLHRLDQMSAELDVCREAQKAAERGERPSYSPMLKTTPIVSMA